MLEIFSILMLLLVIVGTSSATIQILPTSNSQLPTPNSQLLENLTQVVAIGGKWGTIAWDRNSPPAEPLP